MNISTLKKHLGRNIALISALVIAIGSISPFASFKDIKVYGLQGDGKIMLALGVLVIASVLIKKIPAYANIIFGSLVLGLAAFDYSKLSETTSTIKATTDNPYMTDVAATIQMGSGLQLIIMGAIGVIAGSVIHMVQKKNA